MTTSITDPFATPGYRFYPTEEELLSFYLRHRLANTRPDVERVIPLVHVYSYHPSELQSMAGEASVRDTEQWFFFCPRTEREMHGSRPPRTTPSGYWKATGSPSHVFSSSNQVIGVKRTMVFYHGRAPTGTKTKWKMNEYKATVVEADGVPILASPQLRNEFSVCRVYISNGTLRSFDRRPRDPSNGHQVVRQVAAAVNVNPAVFAHQPSAENSNSSSSGENGSRGLIHGSDHEAAIDWNSLSADFGFDIDFCWTGAWPQL